LWILSYICAALAMDHIAVVNPKLNLIEKILNGQKKIESRWLKNKSAPWDKIKVGEKKYFKDAGKPITAMAEAEKVMETTDMKKAIGLFGSGEWAKGKNYCVLIWMKNPRRIAPFKINKSGFGSATAWLVVEDINKVKII